MKSCSANHVKVRILQNLYQPITPLLQAVTLGEVCPTVVAGAPTAAAVLLAVAAILAGVAPVNFTKHFCATCNRRAIFPEQQRAYPFENHLVNNLLFKLNPVKKIDAAVGPLPAAFHLPIPEEGISGSCKIITRKE